MKRTTRRRAAKALAVAVFYSAGVSYAAADTYRYNARSTTRVASSVWRVPASPANALPKVDDNAFIGNAVPHGFVAVASVHLPAAVTAPAARLADGVRTGGIPDPKSGGSVPVTPLAARSSGASGIVTRDGGSLNIQSVFVAGGGTLGIQAGDTIVSGGAFVVTDAGSILNFINASPGGPISTTVNAGATLNLLGGTLHSTSAVDVNGGTLNFVGGNLDASGGTLTVTGTGSTVGRAAGNLAAANVRVRDGASLTLAPGDVVTSSVAASGTGATVTLGAALATESASASDGGTLNLDGHALATNSLQLGNTTSGTLARGGGTLAVRTVTVAAGSSLDILPGDTVRPDGIFSAAGSGSALRYDNTGADGPAYANATGGGTLRLLGGTLRTAFQVTVADGGTLSFAGGNLDVSAGALTVSGPTSTVARATGTFAASSVSVEGGAALALAAGDLVSESLTAFGTGSTVTLGGTLATRSAFAYDGGTINLNGRALSTTSVQLGNTTPGTLARGGSGGTLTVQSVSLNAGSSIAIGPTDTITPGGVFAARGAGSTLTYNTASAGGPSFTFVRERATLKGTGQLHSAVTIDGGPTPNSGGILAPGNSVGTLGVDRATLNGGSTYEFEFAAAGSPSVGGSISGTPGTSYDTLAVLTRGSNFHVGTSDAAPVTIKFVQVAAPGAAGLAPNQSYRWAIVTGSGLNVSPAELSKLVLDTSNFPDHAAAGGSFHFSTDAGGVYVEASTAPEPTTAMLFGIASGSLLLGRWRRRADFSASRVPG